jgi:hypothetical protein
MSEMISTNYLFIMKKDIENKIATAERQNESFKKNGLYPDYNMNDIIDGLKEQYESVNKCIELADLDYADLYDTTSPDNVILAEDLISEEAQLQEDCKDKDIEGLFEESLKEENESLMIIDGLIESVENNRTEEQVKTVIKGLGITESELFEEEAKEQ